MTSAHRRAIITGGTALMAARTALPAEARAGRAFVLIHGAWHGGWCWHRVAALLRASGHQVLTPSLTGLGDRAHLAGPGVNLSTHIADILGVLEAEEVEAASLVLHSYADVPGTAAADQAESGRLSSLIFLDAVLPVDGQPVSAHSAPEIWAAWAAAARTDPAYGLAPAAPGVFGVTDPADIAWLQRRLRPQPLGSYEEAPRLSRPIGQGLPIRYLCCEAPPLPAITPFRQRARGMPDWQYEVLSAPHDAMVTHPAIVAEALLHHA